MYTPVCRVLEISTRVSQRDRGFEKSEGGAIAYTGIDCFHRATFDRDDQVLIVGQTDER